MGVSECSRKNCDNVMPNHYSREFGYLCSECFSQLETLQSLGFIRKMKHITKFMESDKKNFDEIPQKPKIDLEKIFESDRF